MPAALPELGVISIHALRVEGDMSICVLPIFGINFYPRPPGGGRRVYGINNPSEGIFLSTPSGWRATFGIKAYC